MFNKNFYPTPHDLINKMWYKLDRNRVNKILEPSAGKGDILDYIQKASKNSYYKQPKLYAIEIEPELKSILFNKGYLVVYDDFLEFETYTKIDTILMNPPFDNGEKHLLKAIELLKDGGQIVCLLNAETIKNPFSNERKRLAEVLDLYEASIEFIQDGFTRAERKTGVETALIYIDIKKELHETNIFSEARFEAAKKVNKTKEECKDIVIHDSLMQIIEDYNTEVYLYKKADEAIEAFNAFSRVEMQIGKMYTKDENNYESALLNIREKYWRKVLSCDIFKKYLTQQRYIEFLETISKQSEIELSLKNILEVKMILMEYFVESLEIASVEMFDSITKHHMAECSKNVHYYSGWKTNKGSRINKKIIIPSWTGKKEFVEELAKVLNYFDGLKEYSLPEVKYTPEAKKYEHEYFDFEIFIKGTMHIWFKRIDLLDKLNLFVGQKKNWLPDKDSSTASKRKYQKEVVQHYKDDDNIDTKININNVQLLTGGK